MQTARNHHDARQTHCGAFSLMELVMVLTIMAVLAAIAVPRYSNAIERTRADAVTRRIVIDLEYAQRSAKTSNQARTVAFKWPDSYELVGLASLKDASAKYVVMLQEDPYGAQGVSHDLGGDDEIIFDIYGIPDTGGSITISVGAHSRTITIDPDTGQAEITG